MDLYFHLVCHYSKEERANDTSVMSEQVALVGACHGILPARAGTTHPQVESETKPLPTKSRY